ncbi:MAG TPA: PIN domain-containing protein [Solirubrobacteraceae bacterium]
MQALIVDAGVLYSTADSADPDHHAALFTLQDWPGELIVPAFVAAEADHLIHSRLGIDAELAFLDGLASDCSLPTLDARQLKRAKDICARYRSLELGLADASIVVLADQSSTHILATFDQRHFRAVTALDGHPFTLLPPDAEQESSIG